MPLLELENVETFYGNIRALKGISLSVAEGEIITLIGANGAGKSTALMTICGIAPPRAGDEDGIDLELDEVTDGLLQGGSPGQTDDLTAHGLLHRQALQQIFKLAHRHFLSASLLVPGPPQAQRSSRWLNTRDR